MDFIQQGIQRITRELTHHRKYNYSQDILEKFLDQNPDVICQHSFVKNKRGENLSTMTLKKARSDTCIIYAHGLGSNKNEVLPLAYHLQLTNFHICAFDFSGSGRSDGQFTTYGLRQQDDVNAVISWLDASRQYSRYILWGRSMGGASIILSQSRNINRKVQCIILDSPFSSFEKAAVEIAARNSIFPQRMLSVLIGPIKQAMEKEYSHLNPFSIDIGQAIANIEARIMLIYSKNDSIVNYSHSKQIGKHCRKNPIELQIKEDHNKPRQEETYLKVVNFIHQSMEIFDSRVRRSRSKGRGISVSSKQNIPSNSKNRKSLGNSNVPQRLARKLGKMENLVSIGSFASNSSYEMSSTEQTNKKLAIIKSVLIEKNVQVKKEQLRSSIKYTNRGRNCYAIF